MNVRERTGHLAALLLTSFAIAGCGGSSSPGGGGGGVTVTQACADSARASCTERDTCSANSFENSVTYGSLAECESRAVLTCPGSLAATGTAQTPAHLESCVAAYSSYTCTAYWDSDPPAACAPPAGALATGTACGAGGQCTSTFCATGPYSVCGSCQPLPTAGARCQDQADCGRNLACVKQSPNNTAQDDGTCAAWVPDGGTCLTDINPCESGSSCVGDNTTATPPTTGTCQPQVTQLNQPCDRSRKTLPDCDYELGLTCIPTSATSKGVGTCQAITLAAAGQPCGDIGSAPVTGYAACQGGAACIKATASALSGTCMAPAADNAPCNSDITVGPLCLSPAKCTPAAGAAAGTTAGTCTVPNASTCH